MRLLNTWSLQVEEFSERLAPHYAILSHRWGDEEVPLHLVETAAGRNLKGYQKVLGVCQQARHDGFSYVWIDTCCIDKTSSTELTEAINSMFSWYRRSIVCYAYLEDLDADAVRQDPSLLGTSRWFTRGWTLQELIAPSTLIFYGKGWKEIGSRTALVSEIADASGIEEDLFRHGKLSQYSIAQRMSWAANRQTTRLEDEAYCLLGLFGVNMPLIYGEGKMAFIRLQEEVMRRSDDQSLFAWAMSDASTSGLLAPSPSCFADARDITHANDPAHQTPFFLTNKGIQITLPILGQGSRLPSFEPLGHSDGPRIVVTPPDTWIGILNCQTKSGKRIGLALDRGAENEPFRRVSADMGTLQIKAEDSRNHIGMKTILVTAHRFQDDVTLWGLQSTAFVVQRLPQPTSMYEVLKDGPITLDKFNVASAHLSIGDRAFVAFLGHVGSFGIFIAETVEETCWELATGTRTEVRALAKAFRHKDEKFLSSQPSWRLPLTEMKGSHVVEVCMETRKRPHGFSSVLTIGRQTGQRVDLPAPWTTEELRERADAAREHGLDTARIGRKETRHEEKLPIHHLRESIPPVVA